LQEDEEEDVEGLDGNDGVGAEIIPLNDGKTK
jgi:hypothetical protein